MAGRRQQFEAGRFDQVTAHARGTVPRGAPVLLLMAGIPEHMLEQCHGVLLDSQARIRHQGAPALEPVVQEHRSRAEHRVSQVERAIGAWLAGADGHSDFAKDRRTEHNGGACVRQTGWMADSITLASIKENCVGRVRDDRAGAGVLDERPRAR
jgi:hypothetical protein